MPRSLAIVLALVAAGAAIGSVRYSTRPQQPRAPQHPARAQQPVASSDSITSAPRSAASPGVAAPPPGAPGAQPALPPYQTAAEYSPTDEEAQPPRLPPLPVGMTVDDLARGDAIFHGKGGCFVCHGVEGEGAVRAGAAITVGLLFVDPTQWGQIDSLIRVGIPDGVTRSPIAMPGRGARGDLSAEEVHAVAAYVWAIAQTRGEPWPGGHVWHSAFGAPKLPRTTGP